MKKSYGCPLWMVATLAGLSIAAGVGVARIEPVGRKADLLQFDVLSEMIMEEGYTNTVVFARYWACPDFYAASVVWSEPHGGGLMDMKTAVVCSDRTAFRMHNEKYAFWIPTNTTYPKPLGEREEFAHGAGLYEGAEMRFAESEAVSRRVYVSDLAALNASNPDTDTIIDVKPSARGDGVKRKLAQLKVRAKSGLIESMELFDGQQRSMGRMQYEYEQSDNDRRLARLVANLPERPEKLVINGEATIRIMGDGEDQVRTSEGPRTVDHVSHKGGRTCTVTYEDTVVGDATLRLPAKVQVRATNDGRLVRSARLMNFKRVDLNKEEVWEAAKAFCNLSSEDWTYYRLSGDYIHPKPRLGPMRVDPNDLDFVRRLIARYPVPETPLPPPEFFASASTQRRDMWADERQDPAKWKERFEARRLEQEERQRLLDKLAEEARRMPKPPRQEIEPNDAKVIRQLCTHYGRMLLPPLTEEQRTELKTRGGVVQYKKPESLQEIERLRDKLFRVLDYHRVPRLAEDRPPEVKSDDREEIRKLRAYYEEQVRQEDRGLGGQLKALEALSTLDRMLRDYDAFERNTLRYLQMVQNAGLPGTYMAGGHMNIEILMEAGEHEKANRLLLQWADKSAATNDPDTILRFVCRDGDGAKRDPWAALHLLDRFLAKAGLSPLERYEGLAMRAICLDRIDKLLATPEADRSELREAQARWILTTTARARLATMVEPAVRRAVSAWEALGPARWNEAKPYSTQNMLPAAQNMMRPPDSTRLQETSAQLDQLVRQRMVQEGTAPRSGGTGRSRTAR